jgi:hypothetical protein
LIGLDTIVCKHFSALQTLCTNQILQYWHPRIWKFSSFLCYTKKINLQFPLATVTLSTIFFMMLQTVQLQTGATNPFFSGRLLAQGHTQGSTPRAHQQALTIGPFSNTYEADAVSPEAVMRGL